MADLGRWLNGAYAVPGQPPPGTDRPLNDELDALADDEGRLR